MSCSTGEHREIADDILSALGEHAARLPHDPTDEPTARSSVAEADSREKTDVVSRSKAPDPAKGGVPIAEAGLQVDPITQITRLAELRSAGHLTEDEFVAAKAELLRRL